MNRVVWKWNINYAEQSSYCHKEGKACVQWVDKYLKDCLCNLSDEISFGLGIISLLAWGVAEIPQIITNFRTKSSHGVSILFLLTWVFGDIFNLVGCLLEPATLPTQYYTALLYTISTVVLLLQSLYYDHLYRPSWKLHTITKQDDEDEQKRPLNPKDSDSDYDKAKDGSRGGGGGIPIPPRSRARTGGGRVDSNSYYFTSARSMAGSSTPPFRSTYLSSSSSSRRVVKSGPSALAAQLQHHDHHSSSEDEAADASSLPTHALRTKPVSIPRSAARGVMVAAASLNLPFHTNAMAMATLYKGQRLITSRKLLQEASEHSAIGQWLGWMMAAIYMGGRFPQIILNIKRGSVEGLNPLMFIFALVANVSYVGSILVRSTEWKRIKANMPWLLDAVVCVALDLFIIMQYVYYKHMRKKQSLNEDEDEEEYQKHDSTEAHLPKPT